MAAYLDHAASTPMRPSAIDAMVPFLRDQPGNPSGGHRLARRARSALDDARDLIADVVGDVSPGDVVFTSGGTEADNLAVLGTHDRRGGHLVASAVEHHAVLDPVRARDGHLVPVGGDGVIDLDALAAMLDDLDEVVLVSVMLVNNEVGTVAPVPAVVEVVRRHAPGALVHTDAVQAPMWLDLRVHTAGADLVSLSAHKVGGPKGVGVLAVRSPGPDGLAPRTLGGGQERGRRAGTPNVAGAVAFAEALRCTDAERPETVARLRRERERLMACLQASVPGLIDTARVADPAVPDPDRESAVGIVHLCIPGVSSEALLFLLDAQDICASAAASCSSGALEVSHVLTAMGIEPEASAGALRLSLGWCSTPGDVDAVIDALPPAVARLRAMDGAADWRSVGQEWST